MKTTPRIVIAGGGFAGLETAFYLRHKLGNKINLTLISDQDYFLFKPNTIYIPFGETPEKFIIKLDKPVKKTKIEFIISAVKNIDTDKKQVVTQTGEIDYDYLVIATGASMRPAEIPGLKENANTIWTIEEMLRLRTGLQQLVERASDLKLQEVLFLVPPNNKCSGPLYELVMMTDTWLERQKVRENIRITWSTFEESYIQAFGPRLNTVVAGEFEERKIQGFKGYIVSKVEKNTVKYTNGENLPFDLLISFPPYIAKEQFNNLPHDERGFIYVDPDSRRVKGYENIFAVGDTADFPVKQAFLALLQADAAAEHIISDIEGREVKKEQKFEPMSMCVMEELNKATFAQVPLKYTGDPMKPVTVDVGDKDQYKVGVSPIWRLGKKILGIYLPWRFGSGQPFHAGFAWDAMDFGLKIMSKFMAK
ncbi:MAG: FAD-dependent oxidoreductase [Bacteroidales bacterium]|nr:MAG: FAD-dependent oxidoreductase [Bacteroidales bacterium]